MIVFKRNKMPVKKRGSTLLVLIALLVLILPFIFQSRPTATMKSGSREYKLEIVTTPAAQEKGLGGRENMPGNQGMIFVFKEAGTHCFWMKDMRFPLDIIWLDKNKTVIKVEPKLTPSTYPTQYCAENTKYVIELNAGEAAKASITVGNTVRL